MMAKTQLKRAVAATLGVIVLVVLLLTVAAALQRVRERAYPLTAVEDETLDIASGQAVRRMAVAYQTLAADLYWIRAIQYYGGTKRLLGAGQQVATGVSAAAATPSRRRFDLLYPLLDLTTTLDPRYNIAYRFGAIFLAEPYPGGPGRGDLAIALLEKGLRAQPDKWEYMQDIGFVHYWWRHDYEAASAWFGRAAALPGTPWWLRSLAANTLAQGGNRASSRQMWEAIRQSAEHDWLRADAERRLAQLDILDFIDGLQQKIDSYVQRTGRVPASWDVLIRAGDIPGIPGDPARVPYELDAAGRVSLSKTSLYYPLPVEPARGAVPRR